MDSLALRKHMLPPSTKMAAYSVSLRPWPVSNTLLSFILASLLTGMAPIPKTVGLVKLGKQAFLCGLAARWGSLLSPNTARYSVLRTAAPPSVKRIRSEESTWRRMAGSPTRMSAGRSQEHQVPGGWRLTPQCPQRKGTKSLAPRQKPGSPRKDELGGRKYSKRREPQAVIRQRLSPGLLAAALQQSQELASYLEIAHSAMNCWVSWCEP
ncbi:tetratricopeptide repeat protein 31 isoform X1 [Bubalus bubalis]|uniref:tetratricopeptide repeat protein 31 isoform X1 n=1 Tax=Bubalus bubalis TaxID=89462 RepID=UPI001D10FF95|nr:tetratricopeptide repeat protein 31 isoform X1 [Bubalus bubalis]